MTLDPADRTARGISALPSSLAEAVKAFEADSVLAAALGSDRKGKLSLVLYVVAIGFSFVSPRLAAAVYVLVAAMWLVPDRRLERVVEKHGP